MKLSAEQRGVVDLARLITHRLDAEEPHPPLPRDRPFAEAARRVRRSSVPRIVRRKRGSLRGMR